MSAALLPDERSGTRSRATLAVAVLLAAAQAVLLVATARDKSDTVDEDVYLPAAAILWAHHDFTVNPESPVLPKWAFGAALRLAEPRLDGTPPEMGQAREYVLWYGTRSRLERLLLAARLTTAAVTVLAGLALWRIGSRFGAVPGLVAQALWTFSPAVLGAGALATLDAWVTAMVVALGWATVRFVERPSARRVLVVGAAAGMAVACKITALGALPVAAAVCAWAVRRGAPAGGRWRTRALGLLAAATAMAVLSLWTIYGFRVGHVSAGDLEGPAARIAAALPRLPFPDWVQGLLAQLAHGARGHRGYLWGETSRTGWWSFYLIALALKTTLGAQALAAMLVAARIVARARVRPLLDLALLAYPVLLFVTMSAGRTQLGLPYILPAFPGAMLWAARAFPLLGLFAGRWGRAAGAAALVLGAVGALRVHPHHLMFFNSWVGGPDNGPRYLVTGQCIGQDQRRLADWQARQGFSSIYYTWYSGRPEHWGVTYDAPPCRPQRGVYALEAIEVHRPRRIEPGCLDWLTVDPPDERIGYSIYVYRVHHERVLRLRAETSRVPFWRR